MVGIMLMAIFPLGRLLVNEGKGPNGGRMGPISRCCPWASCPGQLSTRQKRGFAWSRELLRNSGGPSMARVREKPFRPSRKWVSFGKRALGEALLLDAPGASCTGSLRTSAKTSFCLGSRALSRPGGPSMARVQEQPLMVISTRIAREQPTRPGKMLPVRDISRCCPWASCPGQLSPRAKTRFCPGSRALARPGRPLLSLDAPGTSCTGSHEPRQKRGFASARGRWRARAGHPWPACGNTPSALTDLDCAWEMVWPGRPATAARTGTTPSPNTYMLFFWEGGSGGRGPPEKSPFPGCGYLFLLASKEKGFPPVFLSSPYLD